MRFRDPPSVIVQASSASALPEAEAAPASILAGMYGGWAMGSPRFVTKMYNQFSGSHLCRKQGAAALPHQWQGPESPGQSSGVTGQAPDRPTWGYHSDPSLSNKELLLRSMGRGRWADVLEGCPPLSPTPPSLCGLGLFWDILCSPRPS